LRTEGGFVFLTAEEMGEADRAAIDEFGLDVLSLMENAGMATAVLGRRLLGGDVNGRKVCCLVGKGNNGGDGLVAARHLRNWGADVSVVLGGGRDQMKDVPGRQLEVVSRMGIEVDGPDGGLSEAEMLVDALLGYGAKGDPREPVADLIRRANSSRIPIIAVDLPSGLDATTGDVGIPCIAAKATVTFAFPKTGFLPPGAKKVVGELYAADISLPEPIYRRFGRKGSLFERDMLAKLW
jgi:hydroxyethylthiazole kinase-like uncharacterized protein yjeF